MHFTFAPAVLALATVASAVNMQVNVGQGGLTFSPPSVNASVGDTVEFIYFPKNHTVTQSTFAAPCQAMANGIDSGYRPVAVNATQAPSMTINVNSTDPVWFYCKQATYVSILSSPFSSFRFLLIVRVSACSHCQAGMVFAINPSANKTFDAFQAAARGSGSTSSATGSATGASAAPSPSGSSSTASGSNGGNGAVAIGVRAGSLLSVVGFVAGVLL